jgi:hypothetical protein
LSPRHLCPWHLCPRELLATPLAPLHRLPLGMLTPQTIRAWHAGLSKGTPRRNSHAYGLLHAILNTAVSDGLLADNLAQIRGAQNTSTKRQAITLATSAFQQEIGMR